MKKVILSFIVLMFGFITFAQTNYTQSINWNVFSPVSGGGGGLTFSIVNNNTITLTGSAGFSTTALNTGQIVEINAPYILPDIFLGYFTDSNGNNTSYSLSLDNNWIVVSSIINETLSYFNSDIEINNLVLIPNGNPLPSPTILSPSSNENYILTLIPENPTTSILYDDYDASNSTYTLKSGVKSSISYFDGLGRATQIIEIESGGNYEDIINYIEYDELGRQSKEYLPYATSTNGGTFRVDALTATNSFYHYSTKYENTLNPYSEKLFEASPLNKILEQTAPGNSWKVGSSFDVNRHSNGNTIKFGYQTNTSNEVRFYSVTLTTSQNTYIPTLALNTLINNGYYATGQLYKSITKDENWKISDGLDKTTEEFKDKQGNIILKRNYNAGLKHDTYYVYDDYGNLTYVLPPKAEPQIEKPNATELAELCYQYKYDHRNRLVEKKNPGKGNKKNWEEIVYNDLDQPILTRDPNLKAQGKWLFTKYDIFGRVAYTGTLNDSSSRISLQSIVNGISSHYVTKSTTSISIAGTTIYYNNGAYPINNISELLTINYYDNYTFDKQAGNSEVSYGVTPITNPKGLITGSKIRILESNYWITSMMYYDNKDRSIYEYSNNPFLETTDKIKRKIDFIGKVEEISTTHSKTGQNTITTIDSFEYDHVGRMLTQEQTIGSNSESIAINSYDELGQLEIKKVGNTATAPLQTINYFYNIRGWLKQINNPAILGTNLFGFKINYNSVNHGGTALYNGNISETEWKTKNDNVLRWYKYNYDALNRITSAIDNTVDKRYSLSLIDYDKNGNILHLNRNGHRNVNASSFGEMDKLTYTYQSESNKLVKTTDAATIDSFGFKDDALNTASDNVNDYTYDLNGNILTDDNKGITNIEYNYLNLPTEITFYNNDEYNSDAGIISYVYDAAGGKIKKFVKSANLSSGKSTYYAGNYVYEQSNSLSPINLKFFNHPEGYVEPDGSNFNYIYQYKDHLGNIRLSYNDSNKDGIITVSTDPNTNEIVEENNYYPFGLKHKGYNSNIASEHDWKFQGQELEESLGLNVYEFELRHYDAAIGRFMSADPYEQLASPYVAMGNNPVVAFDPDGGQCYDSNGNVIACPENEMYDDYRDNEDTSIVVFDEVVIEPSKKDDSDEIHEGKRFDYGEKHINFDEKSTSSTVVAVAAGIALLDGPETGPADIVAVIELGIGLSMVSILMQAENSLLNNVGFTDGLLDTFAKGGNQGQWDDELSPLSGSELLEALKEANRTKDKQKKRRIQKEQKRRGGRNKQKDRGRGDIK